MLQKLLRKSIAAILLLSTIIYLPLVNGNDENQLPYSEYGQVIMAVPDFRDLESDSFVRRLATKKRIIKYITKTENIKEIERAVINTDTAESRNFLLTIINDWFYRDIFDFFDDKGKAETKIYEEDLRQNKITRLDFLERLIAIGRRSP